MFGNNVNAGKAVSRTMIGIAGESNRRPRADGVIVRLNRVGRECLFGKCFDLAKKLGEFAGKR